jgi:hypothetical protein
MTLKTIEIQRVKGINEERFELNILPNKPSLMVAPNGFGKSSFTTGFGSMNQNRIALAEEDHHQGNVANEPMIRINYLKPDGEEALLQATSGENTISNFFDVFVIKSPLKAKGSANFYGGATASLQIEPVVLIDNIPANVSFGDYSINANKERFGANGKVLRKIGGTVFGNPKVVQALYDNILSLQRAAGGQTFVNAINAIIAEINENVGTTTPNLLNWIDENFNESFAAVRHYCDIAEILKEFDLGFSKECENYLAAIQVVWLYSADTDKFRNACKYSAYKLEKSRFEEIINDFNTTWKNIRARESDGSLVISFPKATEISNGQRDILSFISMIFKAERKLKKDANILVVDEVFDYLDDANLVTAQYYITKLIKRYKDRGKRIYPLIMTHLNPRYFKNYTFKEQKVYYLQKTEIAVSNPMKVLLKKRGDFDEDLADEVSKKLFHFHPEPIDVRAHFAAIGGGLRQIWGEGDNFNEFIAAEVEKYVEGNTDYDPFAICCAVRKRIEQLAYEQIDGDENQQTFLSTHTTKKKLDKAQSFGINVPEVHYLLGVIHNEAMHWKEHQDNVTPIATKLENAIIKKLIRETLQ